MKKLICIALTAVMLASATVFADGEKSDVERWREYSAPYVSEYDLSGDGAVDGRDLITAKERHSEKTGEEAKKEYEKARVILDLLLDYDGDRYDVSHDGNIGWGDCYIAGYLMPYFSNPCAEAYRYDEITSVYSGISDHIRKYGIAASSAKDPSPTEYPETVQKALAKKTEPVYSTGRTFSEALCAVYPSFFSDPSDYLLYDYYNAILYVTINHDYCDPAIVRYDESYFPELDLCGVNDSEYRWYLDLVNTSPGYWETHPTANITLELILGDSETVESALAKLEPRHYADIFFAEPFSYSHQHPDSPAPGDDIFIELPVCEGSSDEKNADILAYRARYGEYCAPYAERYDKNNDGTVDGDDFLIAYRTLWNTAENADWSESATIASILLGYEEDPCDISRNGTVSEYDIMLVGMLRYCLKEAIGDYAGPTENDIRLAILDQGGLILKEAEDLDKLEYPDSVRTALDNKKEVDEKSFSEKFDEELSKEEITGWYEGKIKVRLDDTADESVYDASFFPELDVKRVEQLFVGEYEKPWLVLYLGDTESVRGAISKLDHRQGADILGAEPDWRKSEASRAPCTGAGDLDKNGKTNSRDVIRLMKAIVKNKILSGAEKTAADINCDGKINGRDVTLVMKKLVNGSTVTGEPSLYCRLLGHLHTAEYATETVHNAYADSPHCEKRTYLVISCGREGCGYIEKILISSKRIANCHG